MLLLGRLANNPKAICTQNCKVNIPSLTAHSVNKFCKTANDPYCSTAGCRSVQDQVLHKVVLTEQLTCQLTRMSWKPLARTLFESQNEILFFPPLLHRLRAAKNLAPQGVSSAWNTSLCFPGGSHHT